MHLMLINNFSQFFNFTVNYQQSHKHFKLYTLHFQFTDGQEQFTLYTLNYAANKRALNSISYVNGENAIIPKAHASEHIIIPLIVGNTQPCTAHVSKTCLKFPDFHSRFLSPSYPINNFPLKF